MKKIKVPLNTDVDGCYMMLMDCALHYLLDKKGMVDYQLGLLYMIPKVLQIGNIVDDTNTSFKNPQRGRVYSIEGIAPAIDCVGGGNREPKIIELLLKSKTNMEQTKSSKIELPEELKGKKFRIRKLTPRECFRLMGVDNKDIDKIQATGVSNSGQYKLAGNSIVVDVLFHIFRKMFIETENKSEQLSLF